MEHPDALRLMEKHCDAWNARDIDALMALFTPDCVYEAAAGPHPFGQRYSGQEAVRQAFAAIWAAFPHATWEDATHVASGDHGFSEWTFCGTKSDGTTVVARGVDLLRFEGGRIARKDTFRKAVSP